MKSKDRPRTKQTRQIGKSTFAKCKPKLRASRRKTGDAPDLSLRLNGKQIAEVCAQVFGENRFHDPAPVKLETGIVRVSDLQTPLENDQIYGEPNRYEQNFRDLKASIKEHGLREPLTVSEDGYVISGNRRLAAIEQLGWESVEVRVEQIRYEDNLEEFLRLLVEFNKYRDKSNAIKLKEEMAAIDPDSAYADLTEYQFAKTEVKTQAIKLGDKSHRSKISAAKQPFLDAIIAVQEALGGRASLRQIHYRLLNNPPRVHANKPDSIYKNDLKSYSKLSDLATRARIFGLIPMDSITDETRPIFTWDVHTDTRSFVRREFKGFFRGYYRNFQKSQPNHIEIAAEKNTLIPLVKPVAGAYRIPCTIGRGFSSLPPRHDMMRRFERSGKKKLVLLLLSDFDPAGELISTSFARSMRDDFHLTNIHAVRVAITPEQVKKYKLPPMLQAKESSVNYDAFVAEHGEHVWELEALEPDALKEILRAAIESVMDMGAFREEIEQEKKDAHFLAGVRNVAREALLGMDIEGIESDDESEDDD